LTPKGRQEDQRGLMTWVRLHDEYDDAGNAEAGRCH
jgi:predicted dithiol-disulfide oxidoreductase (DUF899 family)